MAYEYKNIPMLSKVKIGEQTYWLKDAELRAIVDNFGDAVSYNVDTTFSKDSANLATSKAVADYLEGAIAGLTGAMHFIGVKEALPETGEDGDVVIVGTAEYVYYNGEWAIIGDEGVYATINGVEENYVKKTLTIAGIDLADAITAEELKTALGLKALAFKESVAGTISTADSVADAKYTPAGSVAVELTQTETSVASHGTFIPAGTVSAPTITVTPNTAEVQHITSVGTLPSYTAAQYVAPSVNEASSKFATNGMIASVTGEELIFSAASTADALTDTGFNAGSYTAAEFNAGALPTLGVTQTVVTGIASAVASAPSFTGTQGDVDVTGSYDKASVKSAGFTGTEATISHELVKTEKQFTAQ